VIVVVIAAVALEVAVAFIGFIVVLGAHWWLDIFVGTVELLYYQ